MAQRNAKEMDTRLKPRWGLLALFLAYALAVAVADAFHIDGAYAAAFWIPSGVLVAGCTLLPSRYQLPAVVGALATQLLMDGAQSTQPFAVGAARGIAVSIEALVAAGLLRGIARNRHRFSSWKTLVLLGIGAVLVATALGAFIGAIGHAGQDPSLDYWGVAFAWWIADALGVLIAGSALGLALLVNPGSAAIRSWGRGAELLLLVVGVLAVVRISFASDFEPGPRHLATVVLVFPFLSWAILRFEARAAVWLTFYVAVYATILTSSGLGPIAGIHSSDPGNLLTRDLQLYLFSAIVPVLLFAAVVADDRRVRNVHRPNEDFLRSVFNHAKVSLIVFARSKSGEYMIRDLNPATSSLLDADRQDLIGLTVRDLAPLLGDEAVTMTVEALEVCSRTATPYVVDLKLETTVGRRFVRATLAAIDGSPAHDSQVLASLLDVTDFSEAEIVLRESEERYRRLVDDAPEAILTIDPGPMRIIECNPAGETVFRRSHGDLVGRSIPELSPELQPDGRTSDEASRDHVRQLALGERPVFEWIHVAPNGESFPCEVRLSRMELANRTLFRAWIADISERKEAEEAFARHQREMARADRLISLGTLVSSIAHEVNNPVHFLSLNLPVLERLWQDAVELLDAQAAENQDLQLGGMPYPEMRSEVPQILADLRHGTERISSIVSQLRSFSGRNANAEFGAVDVNECVKGAVRLLESSIRKTVTRFNVETMPELPAVRGDRIRIEQVIVNLLLNACQALEGREGGLYVKTSWDCETDTVAVLVHDDGSGIPKDVLPHITDPFFTTRGEEGGTGLGLAVAASIVEDHQGSLGFQSTPGKGTEVVLRLPVHRQEPTL